MAKSKRKRQKAAQVAKKARKAKKAEKTAEGQTKAAEYVNHLLELHKLQGALLTRLNKEV